MIGTNLQRKRSERGASLLLLVAIVGLAFIVTVAAFLVAASTGQDTARLATAKVDIATREDALMRVILQQTATGMLPGTAGVSGTPQTWTTIMTNAVNQLNSTNGTTYVDPTELAALLALYPTVLTGVSPANMADTGGTALGIFQGYLNSEVPYGGTSGLANSLSAASPAPSPYNTAVDPPLLGWLAGTTLVPLSPTIAVTTPQEFFLGSLYTSTSSTSSTPVTNLSLSKRWANFAYPNVRFGYKQPGDATFIGRRVWWRIPVLYQTAQQTIEDQAGVSRYPSFPANYVLSVYEIPSQLPISGNANLRIGLNADNLTPWASGTNGINVVGSIYGGQVQLSGGTFNGVSSRQQVNILNPTTVGSVAYANTLDSLFDQPGTREQIANSQPTPGAAPVSVAGNDGKVSLVPVMPGNQFYMSVPPTASAPSHWDLYARPYYRCRIRIIISGTDSNLIYNSQTGVTSTTVGAITVTIVVLSDPLALPDQILGFPDSAGTTYTYSQLYNGDPAGNLPSYLSYTSTGTGTGVPPGGVDRNLLVVDVLNMVPALGTGVYGQLYSIYVGSKPTTEPATPYTSSDPGVGITDTQDLGVFSPNGLSIVSNQTLYLLDSFNQGTVTPPTSIYAPQVLYGMSGAVGYVSLKGQVSVDPAATPTPGSTPTPVNPFSLSTASGSVFTPNYATLGEIVLPNLIPPITRMSLMFTIERERTN
jgi:hypothetical protein